VAARTRPGRGTAGTTAVNQIHATARRETRLGQGAAGAATTKETSSNQEGADMENKANEMVETWVKAQREFSDNVMKAQKEGVERWAEGVLKMQESFLGYSLPDGPVKEARNFYASLMTVVVNSVKAVAEDSAKIQETVKAGLERQVQMSREGAQRFTSLFPAAARAK
jgi:hypothetical protein